jgi:outer membrane immunogenic protein
MTRIRSYVAAGIAAASLASTASAAEFNGPFVGAQVGWTSNEVKNPETSLGSVPLEDDQQSITGGIYAGYDRKVADHVVIGVEGGLDFASDDDLHSSLAGNSFTIDPKRSFDLTARAGYLTDPSTLVYARGGYTNARTENSLVNAAGTATAYDNRDGWLVGGGVERQFMSNASARLEYLYSDLSEGDGNFDRHRVLAGVSYRF